MERPGEDTRTARPGTSELAGRYEAVVIGSGFGGTICALTLANKFAESPEPGARVCMLERGQWWLSKEVPDTAAGTTDGRATVREYLDKSGAPYATWPSSDDFSGFAAIVKSSRRLDPVRGVYDYTSMKNVSVLSASGVGGGSLIYFNLTARPDPASYADWAIQRAGGRPLDTELPSGEVHGDGTSPPGAGLDYFDVAEEFLGINKITTTAALGVFKLGKSRVFQEAAEKVERAAGDLMNPGDLDADLSITDVSGAALASPSPALSWQANVCQRQGRCGVGCLPEARHTMSDRLYEAIRDGKPVDVFPLCRVDSIERGDGPPGSRYRILLTDFRDDPEGLQRAVEADTVVLAAGALGSTQILLRSKTLALSGALGTRFSTNGDTFGIVSPTKEVVDAYRGPLLTSIARYKDKGTGSLEFSLEDLGVPKMFGDVLPPLLDAMALEKVDVSPKTNIGDLFKRHYLDRVKSGQSLIAGAVAKLGDEVARVEADLRGIAAPSEERLRNVVVLFGMGRDEPVGRLVVDGGGALDLAGPYDLEQRVYSDIVDRMKLFAREVGKEGAGDLTIPFWDAGAKRNLTAHPLGGCPMGEDASQGVVDGLGRVYSGPTGKGFHDGLYVADGSIIPTSLGVNPSLTICAVAFRIAEEMAGDRRYWPRHHPTNTVARLKSEGPS